MNTPCNIASGFALLTAPMQDAIVEATRGRHVYDLGAGDLTLARWLAQHSRHVTAVDRHFRRHLTDKRFKGPANLRIVERDFKVFNERLKRLDASAVAFVSWPWPHNGDNGLIALIQRFESVLYVGKNTDCIACGTPGLYRHLLQRSVVGHIPHRENELIVYGPKLAPGVSRVPLFEERCGMDINVVHGFDEGAVNFDMEVPA